MKNFLAPLTGPVFGAESLVLGVLNLLWKHLAVQQRLFQLARLFSETGLSGYSVASKSLLSPHSESVEDEYDPYC